MFDAKRLIGRAWSEASVQNDKKFFPFTLKEKNGKPHVVVKVIHSHSYRTRACAHTRTLALARTHSHVCTHHALPHACMHAMRESTQ